MYAVFALNAEEPVGYSLDRIEWRPLAALETGLLTNSSQLQLAVNDDSVFVGSVSGGCIESAVVQEALAVIVDGAPRTLEFGVSNENAWQVGLACGGTIRVYVERVE